MGSLAFTDDAMVWTDSTNGAAGQVHVRDLATGEERPSTRAPVSAATCSRFGAAGDRIVMGQYCGTYDGGVRDDRVQVLDTDGDQVVTLQGSGVEGSLTSVGGEGVVTVTSYERGGAGTYVYDLGTERAAADLRRGLVVGHQRSDAGRAVPVEHPGERQRRG